MTQESKTKAKAKTPTKAKTITKAKTPTKAKAKTTTKSKAKAKAKIEPKTDEEIEIERQAKAKEKAKALSHGRLLTRFTQLGPYLRKEKSAEQGYFFDCLSACVNAKKSPDTREFWGWWLELTPKKNGFKYTYTLGKYDSAGLWKNIAVPSKYNQEVKNSLDVFYQKISAFLEGELELNISALSSLKLPKLKSLA